MVGRLPFSMKRLAIGRSIKSDNGLDKQPSDRLIGSLILSINSALMFQQLYNE